MQEKSFSCYFQKENKLRFIKKSFFITKKGLSLKCRKKPTTKKNIMRNYLNALVEEKGLDLEATIIEAETTEWGTNFIPLGCVIDYIMESGASNQAAVRDTLVKIDFANGNVMHFFKHVASFMAK